MALTPEDVVNQKFTITKFRDGYDLDQVDDFLDTIVEELRQHEQEKAELQQEIDQLKTKLAEAESAAADAQAEAQAQAQAKPASEEQGEEASSRTIVVDAPTPAAPVQQSAGSSNENDAIKSSAMLQLALELHDKHIHDGEEKRDQLIRDAQETSKHLIEEAQKQRADELRILSTERSDIGNKIKELREFEGEYRSTLRSYIQSQLRGLDGSPEPSGAPDGLE